MEIKNWHEKFTDEQIEWLKNNRIPWCLLTSEEKKRFDGVPVTECEYSGGIVGVWVASTIDKSEWLSAVYRLRPGWKRPFELSWVEVVPWLDEFGDWFVPETNVYLDELPRCGNWLWTKWEWTSTETGIGYVWYEYPGSLKDGHPPKEFQFFRERCDMPPQPVLVRLLKEVSK